MANPPRGKITVLRPLLAEPVVGVMQRVHAHCPPYLASPHSHQARPEATFAFVVSSRPVRILLLACGPGRDSLFPAPATGSWARANLEIQNRGEKMSGGKEEDMMGAAGVGHGDADAAQPQYDDSDSEDEVWRPHMRPYAPFEHCLPCTAVSAHPPSAQCSALSLWHPNTASLTVILLDRKCRYTLPWSFHGRFMSMRRLISSLLY